MWGPAISNEGDTTMGHRNDPMIGITDAPAVLAGDTVERLARVVGLISAVLLLAVASGLV
jgi:hypothetical protein